MRHLTMRNRVVLTNKTPTGLVRGFGGPQVYFALERLMHRIAMTLGLATTSPSMGGLADGSTPTVGGCCWPQAERFPALTI